MEKQQDTILNYFPPNTVIGKDYGYYVFNSGWIYCKRKTGPSSMFGANRTTHILKIKNFNLILLGNYPPEKVAEWIKSKKKIPKKNPATTLHRFFGKDTYSKPEVYYDGNRVVRMSQKRIHDGNGFHVWIVAGYENDGELFWKLKVDRQSTGEFFWIDLKGKPTKRDIDYYILREEIT